MGKNIGICDSLVDLLAIPSSDPTYYHYPLRNYSKNISDIKVHKNLKKFRKKERENF